MSCLNRYKSQERLTWPHPKTSFTAVTRACPSKANTLNFHDARSNTSSSNCKPRNTSKSCAGTFLRTLKSRLHVWFNRARVTFVTIPRMSPGHEVLQLLHAYQTYDKAFLGSRMYFPSIFLQKSKWLSFKGETKCYPSKPLDNDSPSMSGHSCTLTTGINLNLLLFQWSAHTSSLPMEQHLLWGQVPTAQHLTLCFVYPSDSTRWTLSLDLMLWIM